MALCQGTRTTDQADCITPGSGLLNPAFKKNHGAFAAESHGEIFVTHNGQ